MNLCSIGLVVLERVEKTAFVFLRTTDTQTDIFEKKRIKHPKTIPGLTRILCVNLSAIGSVVLEKVTKPALYEQKKLDKQTNRKK